MDGSFNSGRKSLSQEHAKWLEDVRKIPVELAAELGVFSKGDALGFPISETTGQVSYVKFRTTKTKDFWRSPGGTPSLPWGLDSLAEATGGDGEHLVIVEGELDKLACHSASEAWVLSVPDGAKANKPTEDIPASEDTTYGWMFSVDGKLRPEISKFTKFILAVDTDGPGLILRQDLAVRLGRARCYIPAFPSDCKDANDVIVKHGVDKLAEVLETAKPLVPSRLVSFGDINTEGVVRRYSTGWGGLDQHMMIKPASLVVVTGPPGSGKSQWTTCLAANMARVNNWRCAILQFEDDAGRNKEDLHRYAKAWTLTSDLGRPIEGDPIAWVNRMFLTVPPSESEEDYTLDWIREVIGEAVKRHGCKLVIVDPWNEVEHIWDKSLTETLYTRNALRQIKRWARQLQCVVVVVTHPSKTAAVNKASIDDWSLYDIEGSNSWNNKADHGVIIYREDKQSTETFVKIDKSKDYRTMGVPGTVVMSYDPSKSLYSFNRRHGG